MVDRPLNTTYPCISIPAPCNPAHAQTYRAPGALPSHTPSQHLLYCPRTGFPVLLYRLDPCPSLSIPRSADYDNQFCTFLMIDLHSGSRGPRMRLQASIPTLTNMALRLLILHFACSMPLVLLDMGVAPCTQPFHGTHCTATRRLRTPGVTAG